jgi:LysR family hydrogen peroxide-inducible transcriptional activator
MTLTELRYITTLAKVQHFGRAAEQCNVSQPTLSIAVKKLESELGIDIFERTKSRVQPTPVGEKIVVQSQLVLEQAAAIKDIASSGKDQLNAPLHVGAIFTIGPYLFPHFIPPLQQNAPNMPLVIEEGYTSSLRARLRTGEVDVIVVALPFTETDVVVQPLYEERFVVVLPESHLLAGQGAIHRQDIEPENVLLLGEGHCFRDQVLEAIPNINKTVEGAAPIRTMTEGSSLETLCYMVASGLGITILPESATLGPNFQKSGLITRPFSGNSPTRTAALAWRASFPRHRAIDALRSAILDSNLIGTDKQHKPQMAGN